MKKILIIEDDDKIASALNVRMRNSGYDTNIAVDAIQGVSRAISFVPDLILLDINLPAGNGIDVAHNLRRLLKFSTPIIFLTASKQPGLIERAAAVGGPVGFIEKPYQGAALLASISRNLEMAV